MLIDSQIPAPFKPELSADKYDVTNFDSQFTEEDAINSVIPENRMKMIKQFEGDFNDFSKK